MRKQFVYSSIAFIICLFCVASCDTISYDDTEKPVLSDVYLNSDTLGVDDTLALMLGDTLILSYNFRDNEYLSTYKVLIDSLPEFPHPDSTMAYSSKKIKSFRSRDEKEFATRQDTIIIPLTISTSTRRKPVAEGEYKITISCLDRMGNESEHYVRKLTLNSEKED